MYEERVDLVENSNTGLGAKGQLSEGRKPWKCNAGKSQVGQKWNQSAGKANRQSDAEK